MSIEKIQHGDKLSQSIDLVSENISKLKEIFPEIVTEDKIDFKVLQDILGAEIEDEEQYYRFTWAGKAESRREAHKPSTGTLRPIKEESVNWDKTQNIYIEGDNLEVLKLLQKSYVGKIKMIYIDPPYNTGKDFVYKDNYKDNLKNYKEITGQVGVEGTILTTNTESEGRFHSNWLNMMYPRINLARNLLKDDGVIFISIDDNEVVNLLRMCDEIFGETNRIANFIWKKKAGGGDDSGHVAVEHEYILCYAKKSTELKLSNIQHESPSMTAKYNRLENGRRYYLERLDKTSLTYSSSMDYPIECPDGTYITPPQPDPNNPTSAWRWGKETVKDRYSELEFQKDKKNGEWRVYTRTWESLDGVTPRSLLVEQKHGRNREGTRELSDLMGSKIFNNPKPTQLLEHIITIGSNESGDILLDFFSGSGSLFHAVQKLSLKDKINRKVILIQLPEKTGRTDFKTIAEIGKERLRLTAKKIIEDNPLYTQDLGFKVFRLDNSNIKGWDGKPENLEQSLYDAVTNIKEGRTEEDVLYEILLKYGLDLTLPIDEREIEGKKVFNVGLGAIFICLADNITSKVSEGIGKWKEELNPEICRVIFKDTGFTDVEKTNSVQTLKRFGIEEIRSI